jgi:ribonuclease HI
MVLFWGASSLTINGISDPAILEALACREAIALAHDMQLQKITVASDCASVVSDMTKPYAGRYSTVIREIKEAAKSFAEATFRHENRASNSEAHRLAHFAASAEVGRQVWLIGTPDGICI